MILSILSFIIAIMCFCACCGFYKNIKRLTEYIDELESEMTKYESHTNGAFKGAYFMMTKLEDKFKSHFHNYEFENGILYIQDPVYINSTPDAVNDDEININ